MDEAAPTRDSASGHSVADDAAECVGRPLGNDRFVARPERLTERALKPGRRVTETVWAGRAVNVCY
jgi:hypothetical protein